jgi:hypothetical protein
MKSIKKLCLYAALALSVGIVGCNLFNPTESANIESDDTDALIYEGYIHFRNAEYSLARVYFERSLAVDSTLSEAWYGLAKSVLNQQKLNVFEMLKYAKSKDGQSAFMNMDDETADSYKAAIDSVMKVLDPFIDRDSTGRTDGKVTFNTISASYTVLHLTKAAILLRNNAKDISKMFSVSGNNISLDWSSVKDMGEQAVELFDTFGDIGKAIKADPSVATEVIRTYVPEAVYFTDTALTSATEAMADLMVISSEAVAEKEDAILAFTSVGDMIDLDGDGCVDEEVFDGFDNDGDGLVDEDMRSNKAIVFETDVLHHKVGQIASLKAAEGYEYLDIDGNGIPNDDPERAFFIENSNDRDANGDHRLLAFINNFSWNPDVDLRHYAMDLVKKDTDINNIQHPLEWRKANIGGCWNNYTEETFLKWFEGRD